MAGPEQGPSIRRPHIALPGGGVGGIPCGGKHESANGHQLPPVKRQPPSIGHQLPPVKRQPPSVGHQLPPVKRQPPSVGHQLPPVKRQPPSVGHQLPPVKRQPPSVGHQLPPVKRQPPSVCRAERAALCSVIHPQSSATPQNHNLHGGPHPLHGPPPLFPHNPP